MQEDHHGRMPSRTVVLVLGINLLVGIFIYWNIIYVHGKIVRQAEADYVQEQIRSLESSIQEAEELCQLLSLNLTLDSKAEKAFRMQNSSAIKNAVLPAYAQWEDQYRVSRIQFISPDNDIVWDLNKPMGAQNDLNYRRIVLRSIKLKDKEAAIESNEEGNSIVSTAPLFNGDKFIGICAVDLSLEKALGDKLEKMKSGNYAIYELDGIESNLLWEKKANHFALNTAQIKKVQQGKPFYQKGQDKSTLQIIVPMQDLDGITVGYIQGEISRHNFLQARRYDYLSLFLITLLMITGSLFFLGRGISGYSSNGFKPIPWSDKGKIDRLPFTR